MRRLCLIILAVGCLAIAALEIYLGHTRVKGYLIVSSENPFMFWFMIGVNLAIGIGSALAAIFIDRKRPSRSRRD